MVPGKLHSGAPPDRWRVFEYDQGRGVYLYRERLVWFEGDPSNRKLRERSLERFQREGPAGEISRTKLRRLWSLLAGRPKPKRRQDLIDRISAVAKARESAVVVPCPASARLGADAAFEFADDDPREAPELAHLSVLTPDLLECRACGSILSRSVTDCGVDFTPTGEGMRTRIHVRTIPAARALEILKRPW
jgi:hypothetical protein